MGTDGDVDPIPLSGDMSIVFAISRGRNVQLYAWITSLWAVAALFGVGFSSAGVDLPPWWTILGLAAIAALADRQSVAVTKNAEASVAFLPLVFAAVAFGPFAGLLVGALAGLGDFRRPYLKWIAYMPVRALTGALAGLAAVLIDGSESSAFGIILLAAFAASVADLASGLSFNVAMQAVRRSGSIRLFLRTVGPLVGLWLPLYVPLVGLLVYGYRNYSFWVVATFLLPALAFQRLLQLYQGQRQTAEDLAAANVRLERANLSFATALVATLDARDRYTAGHSAAVAIYSRDIARRMGLPEEEQRLVHLCGLVHDIGKIGLPAGLLEKPGALTLEERRQMEEHSAIGERILSKVEDYAEIARIVRHHHERVDGLGYPDGLQVEEIPLLARIIAVADAYNAMTSDRPYRDAMPSRVARLRLAQAVEGQFDTSVVAAFEAILAGAPEAYRAGSRDDFLLETQSANQSALLVAAAG
jgi:putative nucleotidyltransferase with HDIG domain